MKTIFKPILDTRTINCRIWSWLAGILVNVLVLGGILVTDEVSAVRHSADRMMAQLRRELRNYRMVLLFPTAPNVLTAPESRVSNLRKSTRKPPAEPKPLAVPDTRLLKNMDPQLAGFVRENPGIESIVTREIVRDLNTRVLDLSKLLQKSSIKITFEIDDNGRIVRERIVKSSTIPSIDHLALEMVRLLEKYQVLWAMKGVRLVVAEIRVGDQVLVKLQGEVRDPAELEPVRRRVQGALAFLRLALGKDEAAFILDNANLAAGENRIVLIKAFEKEPLVAFLARYYQAQPAK